MFRTGPKQIYSFRSFEICMMLLSIKKVEQIAPSDVPTWSQVQLMDAHFSACAVKASIDGHVVDLE